MIDDINKTAEELELDHNCPLEEQYSIIKLNMLAKRKRKNIDDLHDYFKSTKRYKESVQYNDHPAGTMLNETFSTSKTKEVFTSVYVAVQKLKTKPKKEFQFSLVGNAKMNDVDLLLEAESKCFSSKRFTRREKDML
ncbi:hypothetical protein Tco_0401037 [Tanacetum coccineum]